MIESLAGVVDEIGGDTVFGAIYARWDEAFSQALSVSPRSSRAPGLYMVLTYITEKISGERIDRLFDKIVAKPRASPELFIVLPEGGSAGMR